MSVHSGFRSLFVCAAIAAGLLSCSLAYAQTLFVGNYNDIDRVPFDGQHPVQKYNAITGAFEGALAFPGRPTGMTVAPDGTLYVSNFTDIPPGTNYRPSDTIERYHSATGQFDQVVSLGVADPYGLTVDARGNIFVAAKFYTVNGTSQGTVLKYDTLNQSLTPLGLVSDPYDVALDANNDLYVTCHNYQNASGVSFIGAVLKYDSATQSFKFFASVPEPTGMTYQNGVLYVSSFNYNDIWRFNTADGSNLSTLAGSSKAGGPEGLAFDAGGNLYTATIGGNDVRRYNPQSDSFTVFAGASSPPLIHPFGLAFMDTGTNTAVTPESPGLETLGFSLLGMGAILLVARRRASRKTISVLGEVHA